MTPHLAWTARAVVPFDWQWSENKMWLARAGSYGRRMNPASEAHRTELKLRMQESLRGVRVTPDQVLWLGIFVWLPDRRGDAINAVKLVADAVQLATGINDRHYKLSGLDWELRPENPELVVTIGQEGERVLHGNGHERPTMEQISEVVAEEFGVSVAELKSKSRLRRMCAPRQVAMWLGRKLTLGSLEDIGRFFERDHTTVLYGMNRVYDRMTRDKFFRESLETLVSRLGGDQRTAGPLSR